VGWKAQVRFPPRQDFSPFYSVETGSEAHQASYSIGTWIDFPEVKRQGREAEKSLPSIAEVKNGGAIPPLLHVSSWRDA
jgi:hypothetical protein